MPNDYAVARKAREKTSMWIEPTAPAPAPVSGKDALKPEHLLNKENTYDKNTYTPEQVMKQNPKLNPAAGQPLSRS